jgi:TetR/AcrR family transcriptional regulator, regulator of autoinduction and epiphytic fitness
MAVKRTYSSDLRTAQARRTRRQIVDAAGALFAEHGFAATSVDAIAAKAGVSRKTVFTSVGGKVQLLKLAYDYAMAGDDEPVAMIDREGIQEVINEPDPYRQVELYARFATGASSRVARLWVVLRGAAEVDPEAAELYERWERERHQAMVDGPVPNFERKGVLRSGLDPGEAADILWLLVDPATYDRLVNRSGWSQQRFADWLHETMLSQILAPRRRRATAGVESASGRRRQTADSAASRPTRRREPRDGRSRS